MGISMLGSLLTGILDGIKNLFVWLINKVTGILIKYVIAPVISVCLNLVMYMLGLFFYNISVFILALIDYVEILFRLLAGLEVDNMRLVLNNGESGFNDLLLQLITSEGVTQAFLSMCIVGLFLLVITTIFQMIKVEYTTEGSKNAKGPILEKAFKGIANLMLLPLLVVFGVFIGNQVLDLIDTATKGGGDSPSISGTLFVTAASEAMWKSNELRVRLETGSAIELIINVIPIAWNSVIDAWDVTSDEDKEFTVWEWDLSSSSLGEDVVISSETVENGFINQEEEFKYWNISQVTRYYDYSEINYLLLIFGGCIVIKTLYLSCFGMVTRLYRCAVLYIVSPMVIGMSPVNDGGMKKWQQSFVGSAISAYGVIIALNVFFIVVKLLLSIKFEFATFDTYFFGASLMENLLKCIFVIGGCTMIEKFSKELGGYFGAEDALSAGKELEKATKDEVKKGIEGTVKTALTVGSIAMGGAGIAASIGKQGLGGTIKSGVKNLGSKALEKGQAVADYMGMGDQFDNTVGSVLEKKSKKMTKEVDDKENALSSQADALKKANEADEDILKRANEGVYSQNDPTVLAAKNRILENTEKLKKIQEQRVENLQEKQKIVSSDEYKKAVAPLDKYRAEADTRTVERLARQGTARQVAHDNITNLGGWGAGINAGREVINKSMDAYGKSNGKNAQDAVEVLKKHQGEERKQKHDKIFANEIQVLKFTADSKIAMKTAKDVSSAKGLMDNYDKLANSLSTADDSLKPVIQQQMSGLADQIKSKLGVSSIQMNADGTIDRSGKGMGVENISQAFTVINNIVESGKTDPNAKKDLAKYISDNFKSQIKNLVPNISDESIAKLLEVYGKRIEKAIKDAAEGKK